MAVEAEGGLPSPPVRWAVPVVLSLVLVPAPPVPPRLRAPVGTVVSPVQTVRTCRRSEADEEAGERTAVPAGSASWLLEVVVWLSVVVMDTLARPRLPLRQRRLGVPSLSDGIAWTDTILPRHGTERRKRYGVQPATQSISEQ